MHCVALKGTGTHCDGRPADSCFRDSDVEPCGLFGAEATRHWCSVYTTFVQPYDMCTQPTHSALDADRAREACHDLLRPLGKPLRKQSVGETKEHWAFNEICSERQIGDRTPVDMFCKYGYTPKDNLGPLGTLYKACGLRDQGKLPPEALHGVRCSELQADWPYTEFDGGMPFDTTAASGDAQMEKLQTVVHWCSLYNTFLQPLPDDICDATDGISDEKDYTGDTCQEILSYPLLSEVDNNIEQLCHPPQKAAQPPNWALQNFCDPTASSFGDMNNFVLFPQQLLRTACLLQRQGKMSQSVFTFGEDTSYVNCEEVLASQL